MLPAITILLVYQTIGEIAALWLGLSLLASALRTGGRGPG